MHRYDFTTNAGWASSLPSADVTTLTTIGPGLYEGVDNVLSYPRIFHYFETPMGIAQAGGTPQSKRTPATDLADYNSLFDQVFQSINGWLQANGFAGSGNVESEYRRFGMTGNWKSNANPQAALLKYYYFFDAITNSKFKVHNESEWQKIEKGVSQVGKDIAHDAKEFEKIVETVAKDAVKFLKNAGEDIAFAPLLLFKPAMKAEIAKEGLHDDGTLLDITGKFLKAKMDEVKQGHHFDRFNAFDTFGFPVAPAYIKAPVNLAAGSVGVPTSLPGLPDPADVVWGFFHKERQKPGSPTNIAVNDAAAAKSADKKKGLAGFLSDPKKMLIVGGIATIVIIGTILLIPTDK